MTETSDIDRRVGEASTEPEPPEIVPAEGDAIWSGFRRRIVVIALLIVIVGATALVVRALRGGDDSGDDTVAVQTGATDEATDGAGSDPSPDSEPAADQPASEVPVGAEGGDRAFFDGGQGWLVPWGDGFLSISVIHHPPPLPDLAGEFSDVFPAEIVSAIEASDATTMDEAFESLMEAGLMEAFEEVMATNGERAESVMYVEPPPPTMVVEQSPDGLVWSPLDGITVPGGVSIAQVASDGERLVVASQTYDERPGDGPAVSTIRVAITTDLRDWTVHEFPPADRSDIPEHVFVETGVNGLAIGPSGWLASLQTHTWLDDWSVLPEDIRESGGGWETVADETGLTIHIYEAFEPELVYDDEGNVVDEIWEEDAECCQILETRLIPWDELGIDYGTWQQYRGADSGSTVTWTADWGQDPIETPVVGGVDGFGSVVGTDAGYVAMTWTEEVGHNGVLFSPDGRTWVDRSRPTDTDTWLDQLVAVEGGIVAIGSHRDGQVIWRADSDGTDFREISIPGVPDNVWLGMYPAPAAGGVAAIVDLKDYSVFEPPDVAVAQILEYEGFMIESLQGGGSSSVVITAADSGEIVFEATSEQAYPRDIPDYITAERDEIEFADPDTGEIILALPISEFLGGWEEAYTQALAEAGWEEPGEEAYQPDFWVLATTDGVDWLLEDIDDTSVEPWPQQAAINNDLVVARFGGTWFRYSMSEATS